MPALFITLSLLLALVPSGPCLASADIPAPAGRVTDIGGCLSDSDRARLESFLRSVEETSSNQIAVLTVPDLGGRTIEEFGIQVARSWQLGQKGRDNGVLLLIAKKERKIRIEVGYGLEGALTDLESKLIIEDVITPAFKAGRFAEGITSGVVAITKAVEGEFTPLARKRPTRKRGGSFLTWLFFLGFAALSGLFRERRGRWLGRGIYYGGIGGGIGGGLSGGGFGGGFSGGGGSFGGGGASGSW